MVYKKKLTAECTRSSAAKKNKNTHTPGLSSKYTIVTNETYAYCGGSYPTNPFTILETQDQGIGLIYVVQENRATDFDASKL